MRVAAPAESWRRAVALTLVGTLLAAPARAQWQPCREPHYRWNEKTDTALATATRLPTSIVAILTICRPLPFTAADRCAARVGNERRVYVVQGWVRRVDKAKDDGDWHIELTARATTPPESCIVVEIPPAELSVRYARARADLDALLGNPAIGKHGVLKRPVPVAVVGAALYDGEHRGAGRRVDQIRKAHGRCNASLRALWEVHPVYAVTPP
jgi:hypothetical protein